jgi:hypothetical protein
MESTQGIAIGAAQRMAAVAEAQQRRAERARAEEEEEEAEEEEAARREEELMEAAMARRAQAAAAATADDDEADLELAHGPDALAGSSTSAVAAAEVPASRPVVPSIQELPEDTSA